MDYSLLIGVRKERFEVVIPSAEAPDAVRDSVATLTVRNGRITDQTLGRSVSSYGSPGISTPPRSSTLPGKIPMLRVAKYTFLSVYQMLSGFTSQPSRPPCAW